MSYKLGIRWLVAYVVMMLVTFLASYAYWEHDRAEYWRCRAIEPGTCNAIEPDGLLGMLLFGLIPLGVTLLFGLTFWAFNRKRDNNEKHEDL